MIGFYYFILWVVIFKYGLRVILFVVIILFLLLLDSNRIVYITTILCNINQDPRCKSKLEAHDRDLRWEPKKEVHGRRWRSKLKAQASICIIT